MAETAENIPQYEGPGEYKGPSMGYLMKTHGLADQIIATHKLKPANILDNNELAKLRQFVSNPSKKDEFLRQHGLEDGPNEAPGTGAKAKMGLVGYAVATDAFDQTEIQALKNWFDSGELDEELKGVDPSGGNL
jgi:hypothetical protein